MLQSILIHQVALIDEAKIEFHDGLQVLTGETGAGKSIVVDAVNLILGSRADREMIRTGCDKATVEAVFDVPDNQQIQQFMDAESIDYDGRTVTIYRELTTGGRNICRICGVMLPLAKLKMLSPLLMDLHGQSEHQFLTDPDMQMSYLDKIGDETHRELLRQTRDDCRKFIENHREYARMVKQSEHSEERLQTLQKDLELIRKAQVKPGETGKLKEEIRILREQEKEHSDLQRIYDELASGESDSQTSLSSIKKASGYLKDLSSKDHSLDSISSRCSDLYYELEEIVFEISTLMDRTRTDPERLEKAENRLDIINRLIRKYGASEDEIIEMQQRMENEYEELSTLESRITHMSREHKLLLQKYRDTARKLTESRTAIAERFQTNMMKELNDLGMENTRFEVVFRPNLTNKPLMPTESGDDRIEFMISPNPGEPLKPLAKIASGGELSRIMLAIKKLEAAHAGVESMVFDEIDTGISGRMAQIVAEKLIAISRGHQVICVTHLPQIAAAADDQYLVRKSISGERTNTNIQILDTGGRTEEVARMISGAGGITDNARQYADGMLKAAEERKSGINKNQ